MDYKVFYRKYRPKNFNELEDLYKLMQELKIKLQQFVLQQDLEELMQ